MTSSLTRVFLMAAFTFMSTNTDNLVIYTGFLSAKEKGKTSLLVTYYIAMFLLLGIIFCLSLFLSKIPARDVKYLGVALSCVGVFLLVRHLSRKNKYSSNPHYKTRSVELMLGITMLMDSFDTTAVFVPFFADSTEPHDLAVAGGFISSFTIWGLSGFYISRLRVFQFLTRHKEIITPVIMTLVGFYIFLNTASDVE